VEHAAYARVSEFLDESGGRIGTRIVDQDQFESAGNVLQGGDDFPGQREDVFFLVVCRNDHGKAWRDFSRGDVHVG